MAVNTYHSTHAIKSLEVPYEHEMCRFGLGVSQSIRRSFRWSGCNLSVQVPAVLVYTYHCLSKCLGVAYNYLGHSCCQFKCVGVT